MHIYILSNRSNIVVVGYCMIHEYDLSDIQDLFVNPNEYGISKGKYHLIVTSY